MLPTSVQPTSSVQNRGSYDLSSSSIPHHQDWGENWKDESWKTLGLRYRQFNRENKIHAHKQGKARNSFTAPHGHAGVQPSPREHGPIMCSVYLNSQMA